MIEKQGNVFDTTAKIIGHGVNCKGVMGAGIALAFKEKYPDNYAWYKEGCDKGMVKPGRSYTFVDSDSLAIANIASQWNPGADARYDWLFSGLYNATQDVLKLKTHGNIIAIPEIGCGIGGLEWSGVAKIIETIEFLVPEITWEVWHYNG